MKIVEQETSPRKLQMVVAEVKSNGTQMFVFGASRFVNDELDFPEGSYAVCNGKLHYFSRKPIDELCDDDIYKIYKFYDGDTVTVEL